MNHLASAVARAARRKEASKRAPKDTLYEGRLASSGRGPVSRSVFCNVSVEEADTSSGVPDSDEGSEARS